MNAVAQAAEAVPETYYTRHEGRGPTVHRSNPKVIHRELATLDVAPGMRVIERGTGSGYSGALLSHLVGPDGHVTSIDIDGYLTRWANLAHHDRDLSNIRCYEDGTQPTGAGLFDRSVAWCTPDHLPAAWVKEVADNGLLVLPLPVAAVPNLTVVAKIRVTNNVPRVEGVFHGGYIEATTAPKTDLDSPGRWIDWDYRTAAPSWISIAWRAKDDWLHTGARTALDLLVKNSYTEQYTGPALDWSSWRTFAASLSSPQLTMARLSPDALALGHTTPTTAAVIQQNGSLVADSPNSPSLAVLRNWLREWTDADRPAPETFTPTLSYREDDAGPCGWDLRLSLSSSSPCA
ncbi:protein-L-isoaspartate O-methyltransferase family protein [Streptomyces sp. NRRL F-5053]|uniref:protein-L-isoaspartate O-methyltransferase family protein n=1 Tax=Streptomyces sp. NRRL F-5053 TaxID=1463854 RepID=UPI00055B2AFA|nr:protein-L-isoaspartate O-methyltransferase [Streptomyces sp. NRRL F-5053]